MRGMAADGVMAVQEGPCDNTPFSLSRCSVKFYRVIGFSKKISPVGRNRPFFSLLRAIQTILGRFSWQSASAEWRNGKTMSSNGVSSQLPSRTAKTEERVSYIASYVAW